MEAWYTFAAITGGAAAALAGLLFVSVSINIDYFARSSDLRSRAGQVLLLFGMVLFIAALTVIPGQAYWMLGTELIVLAVICMVGMVMLLQGRTVNPMASLSSMLLIVAGIVLIIGLRAGLYLLVVPVLANLGFGFYLAWMLLLAFRSE